MSESVDVHRGPIMPTDTNTAEPIRFIRIEEVLGRVGLGRSKLYEMMAVDEFPKPLKLGRASVWPESAITEWQRKQMSAA